MTCRVLIESPDGLLIEVRGMLDSASCTSFISERITQALGLKRSTCKARILGIAGLFDSNSSQSVASFRVSPVHSPSKGMNLSAIVVPRITCDHLWPTRCSSEQQYRMESFIKPLCSFGYWCYQNVQGYSTHQWRQGLTSLCLEKWSQATPTWLSYEEIDFWSLGLLLCSEHVHVSFRTQWI